MEQMNENQRRMYDLMLDMWYNELENVSNVDGVSDFEIWCEDSIENEEQKYLLMKMKEHVDAITDLLYTALT